MVRDTKAMDATAVVQAFKSGALTPASYAADLAARIDAHSQLNALQSYDADYMITAATSAFDTYPDGALAGLPLVIKDNINTARFPTSAGTRALMSNTPKTNAQVLHPIIAQGGVIGGKAGMHELAFGITSNNAVTGPIRNPVDPNMIPGGSSGGTAAAVAAGLFPAGLGSDTGGSCRIPAALCGIVGFRPTTGRYAKDGIVPISHTRDTPGPLARSVRDIALLDGIMAGEGAELEAVDLSSFTLGVPKQVFFDDLDTHVAVNIETQLAALSKAGARLVDVAFDGLWEHNAAFGFPVVFFEVMRELPDYLSEHAPGITIRKLVDQIGSPDVAAALNSQLGPDRMPESVYRAAIDTHRPAMRYAYAKAFEDHALDAIVFPTTPLPARPIGEDDTVVLNGQRVPTFRTYVRNTDLGSNLGVPGISLPCPVSSGLPVGIEFDGMPKVDRKLLALAHAVETLFNTV